jgi:hypothetical protein
MCANEKRLSGSSIGLLGSGPPTTSAPSCSTSIFRSAVGNGRTGSSAHTRLGRVKLKPIVAAKIIRDNGPAITIQLPQSPLSSSERIKEPVTLEHSWPARIPFEPGESTMGGWLAAGDSKSEEISRYYAK